MQLTHYQPRALPQPLTGLVTLALDLRWSWHHGSDALWRAVDPQMWEATANPWFILESVADARLAELAQDAAFLGQLREQLDARETHFAEPTWFSREYGSRFKTTIAYFSMEFALSEALPIYSGGLGVLAGDFLKTACDLDVPVLGIGLLYQLGYFRQALDASGNQIEFYPYNDPTMLPVVPLRDAQGGWMHVTVSLPGRDLLLRAWRAEVGRRTLLLLDSNDLRNEPGDRGITGELYGGGPELRLQQEIVLGIGGWRLLEQLGMDVGICHLNEGHAAFAILERARTTMRREGVGFDVALRATRPGNLFTTHTPVSAGFDQYAPRLVSEYFDSYARDLGISPERLLALGRAANPDDTNEPFNMAYLAVHGAGAVNGVSRLHAAVSRGIFEPLFPHWPQADVPVGYVTNGVHMPSWDSAEADKLWTEACGKARWRGDLETIESDFRQVDDERLWALRCQCRAQLVEFLQHYRTQRKHQRGRLAMARGTPDLDPNILTIGFARRFTEYKRPNLLLRDPERLLRLLTDHNRPIQLVFAGKAHPRDADGKHMLREWQDFLARPDAGARVVFLEDYDLALAARLTQGVDLWLNTPRRPWEASGTSGMKVLVNGGLNISELDGWWAEAYQPGLGWALGDGHEHADTAAWDLDEADALYRQLEKDIIPCFYDRDQRGLPHHWIGHMRESMARLTPTYSTNRMLREYMERYYAPMVETCRQRTIEQATALQERFARLENNWSHIHFGAYSTTATEDGYQFSVQVYLGAIRPDDISVELYADPADATDRPVRHTMERSQTLAGATNGYLYEVDLPTSRPAADFTPRILCGNHGLAVPLEANFIRWFR